MDGESLAPHEHDTLKQIHAEDSHKLINPQELKRIKSALRTTYSSEIPLPNADQFQKTLMQKIAQEQPEKEIPKEAPSNVETFPAQKAKRQNWLVNGAAMAACFLLGLLVNLAFLNKNSKSTNAVVQVAGHTDKLQPVMYTAYENLSAGYLSDDETNVIIVEGLDAIPDDIDLFALADSHSRQPIRVHPKISYPEYDN